MRARLQRDSARSWSKEAFSDNWPPNQCMLGVSIDASGSIMILHSLDFKFRFMYSYKNLPFGTFNMSKKTISRRVSCPVRVQVWPSTESLPITRILKECW